MGVSSLLGKTPKGPSQAELKAQQDKAAQEERQKIAAETAAKENRATAQRQEASQRVAFTNAIVQDDEETRRKYLKKV